MSNTVIGFIDKEVSKEDIIKYLGLLDDFTYGRTFVKPIEKEVYLSYCYGGYYNITEEYDSDLLTGFKTVISVDKYANEQAETIVRGIVEHFDGGYVVPNDWDMKSIDKITPTEHYVLEVERSECLDGSNPSVWWELATQTLFTSQQKDEIEKSVKSAYTISVQDKIKLLEDFLKVYDEVAYEKHFNTHSCGYFRRPQKEGDPYFKVGELIWQCSWNSETGFETIRTKAQVEELLNSYKNPSMEQASSTVLDGYSAMDGIRYRFRKITKATDLDLDNTLSRILRVKPNTEQVQGF